MGHLPLLASARPSGRRFTGRPRRSALLAALGCTIAFGAAGCGGGGDQLTAGNLERFGVARSDLPGGYEQTLRESSASMRRCLPDEHRTADAIAKLGMRRCATTTYKKASADGVGSNLVGATLVLLGTRAEASKAMRELRRSFLPGSATQEVLIGTPHSIAVIGLGEESTRGVRVPVETGDRRVDIVAYAWRRGNVAVLVGGSTLLHDFDATSLLAVARKVDRRIADGLD